MRESQRSYLGELEPPFVMGGELEEGEEEEEEEEEGTRRVTKVKRYGIYAMCNVHIRSNQLIKSSRREFGYSHVGDGHENMVLRLDNINAYGYKILSTASWWRHSAQATILALRSS